jgi:ADP-heptose:LPS heptosyltransferase
VPALASNILLQDAHSILVVRLDTIGDLVLMSPFQRELRRSNASAWITLAVDARFVNLIEICPHVNEVVTFKRYGARSTLWRRQFELALAPRWDVDYFNAAVVAYFSGAEYRIGYSQNVTFQRQQHDRGLDRLFTRALDDRTCKHEVERNLDFLIQIGGLARDNRLELWLNEEDREAAQAALTSRGIIGNDMLIGIAPGARHPKRIWPLDRFIELGRALQREHDARLLIVGGPEDREKGLQLQECLGNAAVNFAGEMTLRQTGALLGRAQLMVTNDSGPMHLAAAAGTAVIEISCHPSSGDPLHYNSPVRFRPWVEKYAVLQPPRPVEPCSSACEWHEAHCILGVSVEAAQEAAGTLLAVPRQQQRRDRPVHYPIGE